MDDEEFLYRAMNEEDPYYMGPSPCEEQPEIAYVHTCPSPPRTKATGRKKTATDQHVAPQSTMPARQEKSKKQRRRKDSNAAKLLGICFYFFLAMVILLCLLLG